jgi:hypothetical protein
MGGDIKRNPARLPRGKPALRYLKCAWLTCSCSSRGLRRRRDTQLCSRHRPRTENDAIESPQSNGMAEAFVRTIKHDYVRSARARMRRPSCTSYQLGLIHDAPRLPAGAHSETHIENPCYNLKEDHVSEMQLFDASWRNEPRHSFPHCVCMPSSAYLHSSTVCKRSRLSNATMISPMSSPMLTFRNAASNASCPIMF